MAQVMWRTGNEWVVKIHTGPSPELQDYLAEQIAEAGDLSGMDLSTIDTGTEHICVWVETTDPLDAKLRIFDALEAAYGTTFNLFPELI